MTKGQPIGWYPNPDDSKIVRHWNGYAWSDPVSVEFAQLKELSILNSKTGKLHVIAFRVGFLALMVLIGILIAFLGIPALLVSAFL